MVSLIFGIFFSILSITLFYIYRSNEVFNFYIKVKKAVYFYNVHCMDREWYDRVVFYDSKEINPDITKMIFKFWFKVRSFYDEKTLKQIGV